MDKLKDLVPPPELCKQIPAGKFKQSALVYLGGKNIELSELDLIPRASLSAGQYELVKQWAWVMYPAPTLTEILEALPTIRRSSEGTEFFLVLIDYRNIHKGWGVGYGRLQGGTFKSLDGAAKGDVHSPTAALRLWLKLSQDSQNSQDSQPDGEASCPE